MLRHVTAARRGRQILSVFDHRCLQNIAQVWWEHRISNAEVALAWPRVPYAGRPTSSKGSFFRTTRMVKTNQGRLNNDLAAKYKSHYQQTQLRWSLPSFWMGTPRRATSMVRDIVRRGSVAPSVALVHPSYCLQCIAPFPISPLNSPLTVLYLRTNLSAPACGVQLPTPPPQIIGERNRGSYNHCTTNHTRSTDRLTLGEEDGIAYKHHKRKIQLSSRNHQDIRMKYLLSPIVLQVAAAFLVNATMDNMLQKNAAQDGDRVIPTAPGWRRCKISLPTDVSGVLVVSFYPYCLTESLVNDILQLNMPRKNRLMFQLGRYSRYLSLVSQGKLLTRLLMTVEQSSTGFALLGLHKLCAAPDFPHRPKYHINMRRLGAAHSVDE
ncbi:hypothetical protein CSKR_113090 [Clonorchis sinensis]|uniref:Uncharacterized protein n=1 Tax=Clonorchis sinensis TaxID=79923 RepID=A0A3R7C6D8_CLOSI|nr:hypothetical protein CSKR_113090 [Clonorchis sinensis]